MSLHHTRSGDRLGCTSRRSLLQNGDTPLHSAASIGYSDIVALLLERGANPNLARLVILYQKNIRFEFLIYVYTEYSRYNSESYISAQPANILTYIHTCIHTCIHTYIYTYIRTNILLSINTLDTYIDTYIFIASILLILCSSPCFQDGELPFQSARRNNHKALAQLLCSVIHIHTDRSNNIYLYVNMYVVWYSYIICFCLVCCDGICCMHQ